jgi:hypothetical protein
MQPALVASGPAYRFNRFRANRFVNIITLSCKQLVNCSLEVIDLVLMHVLVHFKSCRKGQRWVWCDPQRSLKRNLKSEVSERRLIFSSDRYSSLISEVAGCRRRNFRLNYMYKFLKQICSCSQSLSDHQLEYNRSTQWQWLLYDRQNTPIKK